MTPTVPLPLGSGFRNPFPQWLDQVTLKFRQGGPGAGGKKVNHFLGRVRTQAELAEGCARLLANGFDQGINAAPAVSEQLVQCSLLAREMDEEMTGLLTKAVLTPYDSEDLKSVSCILARLVDSTRDTALEVECTRLSIAGYARIQNSLVEAFEASSALVCKLGSVDAETRLWEARRQARTVLRTEQSVVFESVDTAQAIASNGVFRRFEATCRLLKRLHMTASWLRYKNG